MQTSINNYEAPKMIHNKKALIADREQEIGLGKKFEFNKKMTFKKVIFLLSRA